MKGRCLLSLVIVNVNDNTAEEAEWCVFAEEHIGMQCEAVGSAYVSQNAAETVTESYI